MDGFIDPILVNRFNRAVEMINNTSTLRGRDSSSSWDRRRDIPTECGFPVDHELTPENMRDLYSRDALAARVVEIWPKECWQVQPEVYEIEDSETLTPFEQDWKLLSESLVSEPGYYKDEENEGASIFEYLLRADIMCGIGRYGVILLGLNDGQDLSTPVKIQGATTLNEVSKEAIVSPDSLMRPQSSDSERTDRRLNFIRVFDESLAQIAAREMDKRSPRHGQPTQYNITFDNPEDINVVGSIASSFSGMVHWTRCVHIVDNISSNEILGTYRCKPVLNDILTAQKSRWGSGEMFWNGASPKLSFETHPQLGGDVVINKNRMKDEVEKALRGLQQWWFLSGMTAKTIAPQAVDPKPFVDVCIQSICIKMEIPIPVFIGHEIGQLAGEMNVVDWNKKVNERQHRQCTPRLICPLVNRLINIGVLRRPTMGYKVNWPDITYNTQKDKAQLQSMRIGIVVQYLKNGLDKMFPPVEFLVRFLEMKEGEAIMVLEKAQDELKKLQAVSTVGQPNEQPIKDQETKAIIPTSETTKEQNDNTTVVKTAPTDIQPNDGSEELVKSGAEVTDIQAAALNGAQISSLLQITDKIAQKLYSPQAGRAIIKAAFPLMDDALINEMVGEIATTPQPAPVQPTVPQAPPVSESSTIPVPSNKVSQLSVNSIPLVNADCGTGAGGFQSGNDCASGGGGGGWDTISKTDKQTKDTKTYLTEDDKKDADKEAIKTHGKWGKKLTENEKYGLEIYSGEAYADINRKLRTTDKVHEAYEKVIAGMDSAIESAPPLTRNIPLYRGVSDIAFLKDVKVGSVFQDKAFVSTTSNEHITKRFFQSSRGAVIKITNTKGLKAISMTGSGVSPFKGSQSENEYILKRGSKFKLKSIEEKKVYGVTVKVYNVEVEH